jgi:hypothetical protein
VKALRRLAINTLVYLVTITCVLGTMATVGAGRMLNAYNAAQIIVTGIVGMICIRRRLEGRLFGRPLAWPRFVFAVLERKEAGANLSAFRPHSATLSSSTNQEGQSL